MYTVGEYERKVEYAERSKTSLRVAVVAWSDSDGISNAIKDALIKLGHRPLQFLYTDPIPMESDVVFSFAPYGEFIQIPMRCAQIPENKRPILIHWNTENPPDLRIPWHLVMPISYLRSWLGRLAYMNNSGLQRLSTYPPISTLNRRLHKFRYVGDYQYMHKQGWCDLFFESSEIYTQYHLKRGLPARCVPWGTVLEWHENLQLKRDIDVLWFGIRRTKRRSDLIDRIRADLDARGIKMHVYDSIENDLIYGDKRTEILNRAKITLNLLPTWYDHAFPYRFHVAAPNRSMVVTEKMLPHSPYYKNGKHFAAGASETLVDLIEYYLNDENARQEIVENAYELCTNKLTFTASVETIMRFVDVKNRERNTQLGREGT